MYTEKVLEHFRNPHNFGKIEKADGIGSVGNLVCGDLMKLYIKVKENGKREKVIEDIKFQTFGCVAAISTSSVITDMVKGKTLKEAINISNKDIANSLGGLPPIKIHCSVLAADALNEAIYNYLSKNKMRIPKEVQEKHERILKSQKLMEKRFGSLYET